MNTNFTILRRAFGDMTISHVLLRPDSNDSFDSQLLSLHQQYHSLLASYGLSTDNLVFAKVFVTDYLNNCQSLAEGIFRHPDFSNSALSVVEQPPLGGYKIGMMLLFVESEGMQKEVIEGVFHLRVNGLEHLFQSISVPINQGDKLDALTSDAFARHQQILDKNGMTIAANCLRTWLYVRDIDNNYRYVVKGRNDYFAAHGLTVDTHFIASTGIGGSGNAANVMLVSDFYSVLGITEKQIRYLSAREYLNPTAEYGVSFERGVRVSFEHLNWIFISGTASIDKYGQCLYRGDVLKQAERILVNIEQLLKAGDAEMNDIAQIIVYLRDVSDYTKVHHFMEEHFVNVPYIITLARVCRPEWLIEMECMAMMNVSVQR
jgi:enamine deaminase RidA (YjgF/YER057c/UK114 family)